MLSGLYPKAASPQRSSSLLVTTDSGATDGDESLSLFPPEEQPPLASRRSVFSVVAAGPPAGDGGVHGVERVAPRWRRGSGWAPFLAGRVRAARELLRICRGAVAVTRPLDGWGILAARTLDRMAMLATKWAAMLRARAERPGLIATRPSRSRSRATSRLRPTLLSVAPERGVAVLVVAFTVVATVTDSIRPTAPASSATPSVATRVQSASTVVTLPYPKASLVPAGPPAPALPATIARQPQRRLIALRPAVTEHRPPGSAGRVSDTRLARRSDRLTETRAIRRVLNRYRDAFSVLDVGWVKAVWPSANTVALRSRFIEMAQQNVEFDHCRIEANGDRAAASCRGSIQSVRGQSRAVRHEELRWEFRLQKVRQTWLIDAVESHPSVTR